MAAAVQGANRQIEVAHAADDPTRVPPTKQVAVRTQGCPNDHEARIAVLEELVITLGLGG
jgi:hypothetical protein